MTLTVTRFSSLDEAIAPWTTLSASDPHATFFSTPAWLQTWWKHNGEGKDLLLLSVAEGPQVVGFAPFMEVPIPAGKAVQFVGTGMSDYADILVDEAKADRRAVIVSVLEYLQHHHGGALFDLQEIPQNSPTLAVLTEWLIAGKAKYLAVEQDVCPRIVLPDTPEAYHAQLKKSFLADLRRGERRLREQGEIRLVDRVQPADGNWARLRDEMAALQGQRMLSKGVVPAWQGPVGDFVKDVLQAADSAGYLWITGLYLNGEMIAYELCFVHGVTVYAWSRAFDEKWRNTGPGKIALLHLLETGISNGYRLFDLLRGEEPYKALWTNDLIRNSRVLWVTRPTLGALAAYKYRTSWRPWLQKIAALPAVRNLRKTLRRG